MVVTETLHSCLHSNIKVHSPPDCVSSFLCIQAMNVTLPSWHTGQPTSLSLCLAYMWHGHNRVLHTRPLIEWLAGSGTHPWSSVTPLPRAPEGSWSVSGCTLLWRRGEDTHCHIGNLEEVTEVNCIKDRGEELSGYLHTLMLTMSVYWALSAIVSECCGCFGCVFLLFSVDNVIKLNLTVFLEWSTTVGYVDESHRANLIHLILNWIMQ